MTIALIQCKLTIENQFYNREAESDPTGVGLFSAFLIDCRVMAQQAFHGVLFETTAYFNKGYPDVQLAEGVDMAGLTEGDDKPFFITLPIGEKGVQSRNERTYPAEEVQRIADTINQERIGGILGHLRDDQRAYEYQIPVIHWVGAMFEGNTLWAKGYIPKTEPKLRESMRIAMKTRSRTGTSIYGTAEIGDDGVVHNLKVESIDIAHPDRVGVPMTAAIPAVTSETVNEEAREETMPDPTTTPAPEAVAESTQVLELKRQHTEAVRELNDQIIALKNQVKDLGKIAELVGDKDGDVLMTVKARLAELAALKKENGDLLQEAIQAMALTVKVESVRPAIVENVTALKPTTRAEVKEAFDKVMDKEWVKAMLKSTIATEMGGKQTRPNTPQTDESGEQRILIPA